LAVRDTLADLPFVWLMIDAVPVVDDVATTLTVTESPGTQVMFAWG
jgi:hypothetical protein